MDGKQFLMYEGSNSKVWPALYPLLMHSEVREKLVPSLRHVINVLSDESPRVAISWPVRHFHEFMLLVTLVVETHCLRKHNSLFIEYVMSLTRQRDTLEPLDRRARMGSLLAEVTKG